MAGILGGMGQQPGIIGGGYIQPPRIPWQSNPMVTMAGLSLLGAPTLQQGLQNVGANAGAGMAAKVGMQRDILAQQEKAATKAEQDARRAQLNEVMKAWPGLTAEQRALFSAQPELFGQYAVSTMKPPETFRPLTDPAERTKFGIPAADQTPYQVGPDNKVYAVGGGGTSVNIDNVGSIPQGYELVTDPKTGAKRMQVIPGGPAEVSERSAEVVEQAGAEGQAVKAETMLDATRSVKEEIKNATMPVVGTLSRPFALYSGSAAGRVRSYVGSLQSGVALQAILKLKEASSTGATGFGALSAPELNLLVTDIGSLDPDNTEPDIFLKTIDRIEARWKNVLQDVERTVPPERLAEMGIDIEALKGGTGGGGASAPVSWQEYFK